MKRRLNINTKKKLIILIGFLVTINFLVFTLRSADADWVDIVFPLMKSEDKDKLRGPGGIKSWDLITSPNESCGLNPDCHHIMNPQYRTYKQTAHGVGTGEGEKNVKAKCGQCHIPALNEGTWGLSWVKSKLSSLGFNKKSWEEKRFTGELPYTIQEGQGNENAYPRPILSPAVHMQPVEIA